MSWFKKGLAFSCTKCGKCCSGFPGAVWLNDVDIENLSNHFEVSKEEFLKKYTIKIDGKISLREKVNYDCVFFKGKTCSVYQARPKQCRTYPFWPSITQSPSSWEKEKAYCEGIEHPDASLISEQDILKKCSS